MAGCENLALLCKHPDQQNLSYHFIVALGGVRFVVLSFSLSPPLLSHRGRRVFPVISWVFWVRKSLGWHHSQSETQEIVPSLTATLAPWFSRPATDIRLSCNLTTEHCERVAVKNSSYCMGKDVEMIGMTGANRNSPSEVVGPSHPVMCRRVRKWEYPFSFCKPEKAVQIPHLPHEYAFPVSRACSRKCVTHLPDRIPAQRCRNATVVSNVQILGFPGII